MLFPSCLMSCSFLQAPPAAGVTLDHPQGWAGGAEVAGAPMTVLLECVTSGDGGIRGELELPESEQIQFFLSINRVSWGKVCHWLSKHWVAFPWIPSAGVSVSHSPTASGKAFEQRQDMAVAFAGPWYPPSITHHQWDFFTLSPWQGHRARWQHRAAAPSSVSWWHWMGVTWAQNPGVSLCWVRFLLRPPTGWLWSI